jgi:hypothetical protein
MANSASSVSSYILAASVLYETANKAINGLLSAKIDFENKPKRTRLKYNVLDKKTLITTYIECNGHHMQVADRLHLPLHRTNFLLNKVGLPNLLLVRSGKKNLLAAADAFYIHEKSFEESAKVGGLTQTEMATILRCSGAEFKSTLLDIAKRQQPHFGNIKLSKTPFSKLEKDCA